MDDALLWWSSLDVGDKAEAYLLIETYAEAHPDDEWRVISLFEGLFVCIKIYTNWYIFMILSIDVVVSYKKFHECCHVGKWHDAS